MIKKIMENGMRLIMMGSLVMSVVFSSYTALAATTISLNSWDLVDSGGHLDYDLTDTKYGTTLTSAVLTWNIYKNGVIRKDSATTICDVLIADVYWTGVDTAGVTSGLGTIHLNTYFMDNYSDKQKLNVCVHEFGHALGLGHNTTSDVMYKNVQSITALSANDKASYDAAAENY